MERRDAGENGSDPNIQESVAPEIEWIKVDFYTNILGNNKLTITVKVTDNAGIKKIVVVYAGVRLTAGYQGEDIYCAEFELTWNPGGSAASYTVEVEAYDIAGNAIAQETSYTGLIEQAVQYRIDLI